MPRLHKRFGVRRIVDQVDVTEPLEDALGDVVRDSPLAQSLGQLAPAARCRSQQVEADRARDGLRIRLDLVVNLVVDEGACEGVSRSPGVAHGGQKSTGTASTGSSVSSPGAIVAGSSTCAPMPSFSLIFFSISSARSGLSRRNARAFSFP